MILPKYPNMKKIFLGIKSIFYKYSTDLGSLIGSGSLQTVWFYVNSTLIHFRISEGQKTAALTFIEVLNFYFWKKFHTWKCHKPRSVQLRKRVVLQVPKVDFTKKLRILATPKMTSVFPWKKIHISLCSRNFQNVKLRLDFVEFWSFYLHSDFPWNPILANSNGPKMSFLASWETLNFAFLVNLGLESCSNLLKSKLRTSKIVKSNIFGQFEFAKLDFT